MARDLGTEVNIGQHKDAGGAGSIDDILAAWEELLEEIGVEVPSDYESQNLLRQAAELVKLCEDAGHSPQDAELDLESPALRKAVRDFISIARPYYQKYDFTGVDTDAGKAKFLKAIPRCIGGSLDNWEKGLSLYLKKVWENEDEYQGTARKMIEGKYNYPAAIDNEGFELEWE